MQKNMAVDLVYRIILDLDEYIRMALVELIMAVHMAVLSCRIVVRSYVFFAVPELGLEG